MSPSSAGCADGISPPMRFPESYARGADVPKQAIPRSTLTRKERAGVATLLAGPKFERWKGILPGVGEVEGWRYGPFLIRAVVSRKDEEGAWLLGNTDYAIEHLPSGAFIWATSLGDQKRAKGFCVDLLDQRDIDWEANPLALTEEQRARVWALLHPPPKRWEPPKVPRKKLPKGTPLLVCPVYYEWFTPSETLRTLDAENARALSKGEWPQYIGQAGRRYLREVMMARFAAGSKAVVLEEDIPIRGLVVNPQLPQGITPDYRGVKTLTERLWKLGSEIHALADCMVDLWRTDPDDWGKEDRRQWRAWEAEFKALIQQGWLDWTLVIFLFCQLPEEDQAKVTSVLGYVGDSRQSHHTFGYKTFLRSPLLPRLRECRRLYRYRQEAKYES